MEFAYLISAVIGITSLIVFFFMADNVSNIRKRLAFDRLQHHRIEYYKYYCTGNKEKAREALLYVILFPIIDLEQDRRKAEFEKLKKLHEKKFEQLGFAFPEYPFR